MKDNKKKRETSEDFVGWKSEDGLLEVVGIHGKQWTKTLFKVICHKCKEDKELFPAGYFISNKQHLTQGSKPCGCANKPKWNKDQYLILIDRLAKDRFIVLNFSEEFHGSNTRLILECLKDGHKWEASINNLMVGSGCPKCSGNIKLTEQQALDKWKAICETEDYEPIGFVDGYKNVKSRFEYKCPNHGIQNVCYNDFVNKQTRCIGCWKEKQKHILREIGNCNGNGYYPDRKDEVDFLYVLDFNGRFIKVGRSFNVDGRIKELRKPKCSGVKNIIKLRIFTATHQEIYDLEQLLHKRLRERNFQHSLRWTTECFNNACLIMLYNMLDNCNFKEVMI